MTTNQPLPTRTESSIDDITWADMTAAGIDTDLVTRPATDDEYVWLSPDKETKVAFGPSLAVEGGATHGWDVCVLVWDTEYEDWRDGSHAWFETAPETLEYVARLVAGGALMPSHCHTSASDEGEQA